MPVFGLAEGMRMMSACILMHYVFYPLGLVLAEPSKRAVCRLRDHADGDL